MQMETGLCQQKLLQERNDKLNLLSVGQEPLCPKTAQAALAYMVTHLAGHSEPDQYAL